MEQKLNIAEILKDKPKRTKLYTDAFGELSIEDIDTEDKMGITLLCNDGDDLYFYNDGRYSLYGVPILFPSKEMRDWRKFAWKKGDVLVGMKQRVIFEKFINEDYTKFQGKYSLSTDEDKTLIIDRNYYTEDFSKIKDRGNIKNYFEKLEERLGGKLNRETLEIEPAQPEFKPFDYVLSNDNDDNEWVLCQFSHIDKKGSTVFVGGNYADKGKVILPYKGNEYLLGTTKDIWRVRYDKR